MIRRSPRAAVGALLPVGALSVLAGGSPSNLEQAVEAADRDGYGVYWLGRWVD